MKHLKILLSTTLCLAYLTPAYSADDTEIRRTIAGVKFKGDYEILFPAKKGNQKISRALTPDDVANMPQTHIDFANTGAQGTISSDVLNALLQTNNPKIRKTLFLGNNQLTGFDASNWAQDENIAQAFFLNISGNALTEFQGPSHDARITFLGNPDDPFSVDVSFDGAQIKAINDLWMLRNLLTNTAVTKKIGIRVNFTGKLSDYLTKDLGVSPEQTHIVISPDRQDIYVEGLMGDAYTAFTKAYNEQQSWGSWGTSFVIDHAKSAYFTQGEGLPETLRGLKHAYVYKEGSFTDVDYPFIKALQAVLDDALPIVVPEEEAP